ncbi:hypothetical protein [Roseovarius aquimarinus]|uniref:Uncharacterized protein n=1 Tax=Roseovarius aquimarinus TaxID=1229156 RepID=A0ABW7I4G0_9RHOB
MRLTFGAAPGRAADEGARRIRLRGQWFGDGFTVENPPFDLPRHEYVFLRDDQLNRAPGKLAL